MNNEILDKVLLSQYAPLLENSAIKLTVDPSLGSNKKRDSKWFVFSCGIPGAGKSYTIEKQLLLDAKTLDSDKLKMNHINYIKKKQSDPNFSAKRKRKLLKPYGGRVPDPQNSEDLDLVHDYISHKKHKFSFLLDIILDKNLREENPTNFILDTTGNNFGALLEEALNVKKKGYNVAIVWVITDIDIARIRNTQRDRKVIEDYMFDVYNTIMENIPKQMTEKPQPLIDDFWVVFNNQDYTNDKRNFRERYSDTAFQFRKNENGIFTFDVKMGLDVEEKNEKNVPYKVENLKEKIHTESGYNREDNVAKKFAEEIRNRKLKEKEEQEKETSLESSKYLDNDTTEVSNKMIAKVPNDFVFADVVFEELKRITKEKCVLDKKEKV